MYNPNDKELYEGLDFAYNEINNKIYLYSISLIKCNNKKDYIIECINEAIISLLVSGVFSNHKLPTDEFVSLTDEIIHNPIILNDVVNKEDEQDECKQDITKNYICLMNLKIFTMENLKINL